jgi:cytochrome c oxidase cbb3-type subunit 4
MDFHDVAAFSRSWGLVFLVVLFVGACAYALWPGNRGKFERAAHAPLDEE